jgi:hypothetical protein
MRISQKSESNEMQCFFLKDRLLVGLGRWTADGWMHWTPTAYGVWSTLVAVDNEELAAQ